VQPGLRRKAGIEMIPQQSLFSLENAVWSVSDLNAYIKELVAIDYRLQELQVTGEVSNFSQAKSGHVYFTLKDESSQIRCVMWSSTANRSNFMPIDGDAVVAQGRIAVYEAMGTYQLYVEWLEPAGRGELARAFEQLKGRLEAEGLFEQEHKIAIPTFPQKIGIVTSANAAALRDIRTVLRRRWPLASVLIAPALVQGRDAPAEIIQAIQWLDGRQDIDTIIVARGGGSIEDLWVFNDEGVARAIYNTAHPVIVGVGHETDFTIADFVADLRAPTPSAAAELAVPDRRDLIDHVQDLRADILSDIEAILNSHGMYLNGLIRALKNLSPRSSLDSQRQYVDRLHERMDRAVTSYLQQLGAKLEFSQARLVAISPISTLARGYAIVKKKDGRIVRSIQAVEPGDRIDVQLADGDIEATVE